MVVIKGMKNNVMTKEKRSMINLGGIGHGWRMNQ